jgi:hypothetical protein
MKVKRLVLQLIAILAAFVVLAACGGTPEALMYPDIDEYIPEQNEENPAKEPGSSELFDPELGLPQMGE